MTQPELGNYIAGLRKEQGLTQEELVEKCNINVRTIQRIEAGEVTPRSYTVKNILEALGKNIDNVFKKTSTQEDLPKISYNKSLLTAGIIAGICYIILGTFNVSLTLMAVFNEVSPLSNISFAISLFLETIAIATFLISIAHYGIKNKNHFIKFSCYTSMVFLIFYYINNYLFYSGAIEFESSFGFALNLSSSFLYGLMIVFLGLGFFIARKTQGELSKWIGIAGIIGGVGYCTIILFPVGIIGTIAFEIMLIILLYKAWCSKSSTNI